jgi:NAD(P)-dependent dehydrogenase (short-subunit alcohol dehydrogenase family)
MTRGILIAGNESSLFSAMCEEAARRVESYAVAFIPRGDEARAAKKARGDRTIVLDWNPPSPISAKTLVLSAVNAMEHIDEAVLVCAPPSYRKKAEALSAPDIDSLIDNNIKGWFFLVRELVAAFEGRGRGTLSLVLAPESGAGAKEDEIDFAAPVAVSAFRSFAQGILLSSFNASYSAMGFSSSEPGEENAFAAHVFKTIEEGKKNSGKWHKYSKFALFGR